jgi:hypothetical protein
MMMLFFPCCKSMCRRHIVMVHVDVSVQVLVNGTAEGTVTLKHMCRDLSSERGCPPARNAIV